MRFRSPSESAGAHWVTWKEDRGGLIGKRQHGTGWLDDTRGEQKFDWDLAQEVAKG